MGDWRGLIGRRLVSGLLLAASVALVGVSSAGASGAAATFTVTGFDDGSGSCGSVDANGNMACTTLRAAVNRANLQSNSPTIELQAGTYRLTPGNGGQLDLATSMNIAGAGPGSATGTTIQQTDGQNRVLEVDGMSTLSGLEITGGHYSPPWSSGHVAQGGGILVLGTLGLQDALVTGNQAIGSAGPTTGDVGDDAEGGGIAYGASALAGSLISDSAISGNQALAGAGGTDGVGGIGEGGGIAYEGAGPLTVQATTIAQNTAHGGSGGPHTGGGAKGGAAEGGGIFNPSNLTLSGSTIAGNTATGGAQGAPASPSTSGGPGGGGGIFSQEGADQLVNSTIFGNTAQGGPAASGGSGGSAQGGGVLAEGSAGSATLQSDTFVGNQPVNLYVAVGTAAPYPFTVHDTILAGTAPVNCVTTSPASSEAYNLEDDAAGSCDFTAANHDLVGANAELASALADNGGLTQTLPPAPGSPVLGSGGQCVDPTSTPPGQPLTVDQRNQPRANPCDIGAFQSQPPRNTSSPAITGTAKRGDTLVCSQGTWVGDGVLQYAFGWLRNGVAIAGATTNTYVVSAGDAGRSLACRVIASYYGSVAAASPFVTVPSNPLITLLRARARGGGVVVDLGCRGSGGQRCIGVLKLIGAETVRGGKVVAAIAAKIRLPRTVGLGQHRYAISARRTKTVVVALNRTGSRLLQRLRKLQVTLAVSQSVATGTKLVSSRRLTIRVAKP